MGREALGIAWCVGGLEDLYILLVELDHVDDQGEVYTCGAVAFPAAQAMNVMASTVDFFVWPATLREISENKRFPSAQMNCVQ